VASGEHRDEHLSLLPDWHNIRGVPELAQLVERRQKGMKAWLQVIQDGIDDGSRCSDIRRGEIRWLLSNVVAAVFDDRFEGTAEAPGQDQRWQVLQVVLEGLRTRAQSHG
jgi:hypothetical protein